MRILVAEDDQVFRYKLRNRLEDFAHCDFVEDGRQAVEAYDKALTDQQPYDLICLDIMMPKMDGNQVLKYIRQREAQLGIGPAREVKVMMLSALDDPRSVVDAFYSGGATAYMVKPVKMDKLFVELQNMGLQIMAAEY